MGGAKSCLDLSGLSCVTWEVAFKTALKRGIFSTFLIGLSRYATFMLSFLLLGFLCLPPPPPPPPSPGGSRRGFEAIGGPPQGSPQRRAPDGLFETG